MIKKGDIVLNDTLDSLFKVSEIKKGFAFGFNVLDNFNLSKCKVENIINVTRNNVLIKQLCSSQESRIDISRLWCKTNDDMAKFCGVSSRTLYRISE